MATKKQIKEALHEARHYCELAQDSFEYGDLENAEGWLNALSAEVSKILRSKTVAIAPE
jgi:hypothetical protein